MKVLSCLVLFVMLLISVPINGKKDKGYEIIEDLSPTHEVAENMYRPLKLVLEIPFDFSKKKFLVQPASITSDNTGNIFIFDGKLGAVYSFSSSGRFRFSFSGKGEGPGYMAIGTLGLGDEWKLNYVKGVGVLVNGFQNKWVNVFNPTDGKFKHVIRLPYASLFYPVLDSKRNLYMLNPDSESGVVQVLDKNSSHLASLLDLKELRRFFKFNRIVPRKVRSLSRPDSSNVFYDLLSGNRFLSYLQRSSNVYVFKNRKLIDQYPVRPKEILAEREERVKSDEAVKKTKSYKQILKMKPDFEDYILSYKKLFRDAFVNKDSRDGYFLTKFEPIGNRQNAIFSFSVDGKIKGVWYFNPNGDKKDYIFFREFQNGLFYGIGYGKIYVCKK